MTTTDHRIAERQAPEPAFEFRIDPRPSPASGEVRQAVVERPEFGRYFTDHMALVDWTADGGWQDPRVVPLRRSPGIPPLRSCTPGRKSSKASRSTATPTGTCASSDRS